MNDIKIVDKHEELLCEIHRNLEMSAESTTAVMKKVKSKELLLLLTEVIMKSTELLNTTVDLMKERGIEPQEISKMKQLSVDAGIMVNTLFDSSDSHIAEMMVKGLEMGVVSLRELVKKLTPSDDKISKLCTDVVTLESTYAHKIGQFVEQ